MTRRSAWLWIVVGAAAAWWLVARNHEPASAPAADRVHEAATAPAKVDPEVASVRTEIAPTVVDAGAGHETAGASTADLAIICSYRDGAPVADAVFRLREVGSEREDVVLEGEADAAGTVRVPNAPVGRWRPALFSRSGSGIAADVPSVFELRQGPNTFHAIFDDRWIAAVKFSGPGLIHHEIATPLGWRSAPRAELLRDIDAGRGLATPTTLRCLRAPATAAAGDPVAKLTVWVTAKGRHDLEVPLQRARDYRGPQVVDLTALPWADGVGRMHLRISDAIGKPVEIAPLTMRRRDTSMPIRPDDDGYFHVPIDEPFTIVHEGGPITWLPPDGATVDPGDHAGAELSFAIVLPVILASVRLTFRIDGESLPRGIYYWRTPNRYGDRTAPAWYGGGNFIMMDSSREWSGWLPVGEIEIELRDPGGRLCRARAVIEDEPERQDVVLHFELVAAESK